MDDIESVVLNGVEIQSNGIIRNEKGRLIGRLVEGADFEGVHIKGVFSVTKEITGWEKEFKKQYTFNHEILGMSWKQGMAITPSMIESFISKAIASAVEAERVRISEKVEKMNGFGKNGKDKVWIGNGEECLFVERKAVISIINPSKE